MLPVLFVMPQAGASTESEFVSRTNGARASYGRRAYAVRSDLTSVARRHAARMAASRSIYHNTRLGSEVTGWSAIGENVGRGGSVAVIHNAFMNSSSHRGNILSTSFTQVGIGTARGTDGQIYVAEVFRRPNGAVYTPPAPAPRRTYAPVQRRTAPPRASRSAPRRPLAPPKPKVMPVPPLRVRLAAAENLHRRLRHTLSVDAAAAYARTTALLVG